MLRSWGWLVGLSAFAVACGGQIDTGDAGSKADSGTNPPGTDGGNPPPPPPVDGGNPPPPLCSPMSGGGSVSSNGDCEVTEDWSCGATKYNVDCRCPDSSCTCSQSTGQTGTGTILTFTGGCPGCGLSGTALAQLCGFPSN